VRKYKSDSQIVRGGGEETIMNVLPWEITTEIINLALNGDCFMIIRVCKQWKKICHSSIIFKEKVSKFYIAELIKCLSMCPRPIMQQNTRIIRMDSNGQTYTTIFHSTYDHRKDYHWEAKSKYFEEKPTFSKSETYIVLKGASESRQTRFWMTSKDFTKSILDIMNRDCYKLTVIVSQWDSENVAESNYNGKDEFATQMAREGLFDIIRYEDADTEDSRIDTDKILNLLVKDIQKLQLIRSFIDNRNTRINAVINK
jgi:hypothetical protein